MAFPPGIPPPLSSWTGTPLKRPGVGPWSSSVPPSLTTVVTSFPLKAYLGLAWQAYAKRLPSSGDCHLGGYAQIYMFPLPIPFVCTGSDRPFTDRATGDTRWRLSTVKALAAATFQATTSTREARTASILKKIWQISCWNFIRLLLTLFSMSVYILLGYSSHIMLVYKRYSNIVYDDVATKR